MKIVNVFAAVDYAFMYSIYKAFTDHKSFAVYFVVTLLGIVILVRSKKSALQFVSKTHKLI